MRQLSQRALQAFMTTFQLGTISAASEAMNLTQPAISRLLKDLEEDIGFPLFHRIRGRLHRTPEGIAFFEETSRSFVGLDRIQLAAENIRHGHHYRLIVYALPSFASTCMAKIIAEFLVENPHTILTAQPIVTDDIIRRVRDLECSVGIVETRSFPVGIRVLHVHEERALCILPPGHRLESRAVIEPEDLDDEVFLHTVMGSQLGDVVWRMLVDREIKPRSIIDCRLGYLVQKLVMEGVGVGIVDPRTAQLHRDSGGVARPFSPALIGSISFIAHENSILTPTEQRFVDKAMAWLRNMSEADHKVAASVDA